MSNFAVKTDKFEGPLDLVVQLLRSHKLHVSDVSLARIADEFSIYIAEKEDSIEELSDFVRVMAVLLLIKTKALLPDTILGEDEEETIAQFEADVNRIALLAELAQKVQIISVNNFIERIERPKSVPQGFLADSNLKLADLRQVAVELSEPRVREETFGRVAVSRLKKLTTVISQVESRFHKLSQAELSQIITPQMPKEEKVLHFIAILELLKRGKLSLRKDEGKDLLEYNRIDTPIYG